LIFGCDKSHRKAEQGKQKLDYSEQYRCDLLKHGETFSF